MKNEQEAAARYIVGIDLGTTQSAVAFFDMERPSYGLDLLKIEQLSAPGTVEAFDTLPSFQYFPVSGEGLGDDLPWKSEGGVIGRYARERGAELPGRLIASAKSWLCHNGVDRSADLLPWRGDEDLKRCNPAEASAAYLRHMRSAWDHQHPEHLLADQDIVLTVPASFDEVARELTVQAAKLAGLNKVVLIEEPQAAFYAWMERHADGEKLEPGDFALVCDVGGGTTDLTLIQVEEGGAYRRIAVGPHLLLGGDNLDLALAHHVEEQLDKAMAAADWSVLLRRCQQAKELLLSPEAPESIDISLPSRGRSVVGGSRQFTLERSTVEHLLLDGFLPQIGPEERPAQRASGFQEFSLPYAPDAGVTRYIADFLARNKEADEQTDGPLLRPKAILFNGGFFFSPTLRQRTYEVVCSWFSSDPDWCLLDLDHARLDLAVARGAACYGRARHGSGTRIAAGLPRAYYVGVGSADQQQALCLLPAGAEEGISVEVERTFELQTNQPVIFPLFTSSYRSTDPVGTLVEIDPEQLREMAPIRTVIKTGKKSRSVTIPVRLRAELTPVGTIDLHCIEANGDRSWRLQFDARAAVESEREDREDVAQRAGALDEHMAAEGQTLIAKAFGQGRSPDAPQQIMKQLENVADARRGAWTPALLRAWWESTLKETNSREGKAITEARWLNLLGFLLRPGFGFPADDWRASECWKRLGPRGVHNQRNEACRAEWWIFWRRIAGGLSANQQRELAAPLLKAWRNHGQKKGKLRDFQFGDHETAEVLRLLGSMERLDLHTKETLGQLLCELIRKNGTEAWNGSAIWALGRLGRRIPSYGPLNDVLPPSAAAAYCELLIDSAPCKETCFSLVLLATRSGDRYRDLDDALRQRIVSHLTEHNAPAHQLALITEGGELKGNERDRAFGEALPPGLLLAR